MHGTSSMMLKTNYSFVAEETGVQQGMETAVSAMKVDILAKKL